MRRKQHRPPTTVGDVTDPDSFWFHMQRFSQWQLEKNYSAMTVASRESAIRKFIAWAADRGLLRPREITKPILERYQRYLFLYRKSDGDPLANRTQITLTTPVRAFFKWLARENYIAFNPASELELPRMERRLPRHILNVSGLVTVLRRSPERLEFATGDRRDDQAFRRVQAGSGSHCLDQWVATGPDCVGFGDREVDAG